MNKCKKPTRKDENGNLFEFLGASYTVSVKGIVIKIDTSRPISDVELDCLLDTITNHQGEDIEILRRKVTILNRDSGRPYEVKLTFKLVKFIL